MKVKIKKTHKDSKIPEYKNGNWMDAYVADVAIVSNNQDFKMSNLEWTSEICEDAKTIYIPSDSIVIINLGFAIQLPEGREMHLLPRSGTFRKYGLLLTNSQGIIDTNYCGDTDVVMAMFYSTRPTRISIGERLVQLKIEKVMEQYEFEVVDTLGSEARGGFGSSGR
jgi:dUTP pyrophosphatase